MIGIEKIVTNIDNLPTLPLAASQLGAMLNDKSAGASDFEKIVRPDPALTINLLRLVNSAHFGLRREVSSVRHAIALVGTTRLFELVASVSFASVIPEPLAGYAISSEGYWRHCIAVAILSENLAKDLGLPQPELIFTAALLHDIGKLAVGVFIENESEAIMERTAIDGVTLIEAERSVLGTTHAEVGAAVADEWKLPRAVSLAARWHHDPSGVPDKEDQTLVDLIHIANILAHSFGYGADVGELRREVSKETVTRLGLRVGSLEGVACLAMDDIQEMTGHLGNSHGGK